MKNKGTLSIAIATIGGLAVVFFFLWAGNDFQALRSRKPPIQIRYDMQYQTKVGAQQPNNYFSDGASMRPHVPGTVPREGSLYPYATVPEAEAELHNPLAGDISVLDRGKNRYNNFCAPCHSVTGQDTTEVVRKGLQKPPNLVASNARGYSDVHLFHIISVGQNIMPGYADKLTPEDRWMIVNYVRELQKEPLRYAEIAEGVQGTVTDEAAASSPADTVSTVIENTGN